MATYTIPYRALSAVSLFAARKDLRFYLQGVYIESSAKGTHLVATNGCVLGAWCLSHVPQPEHNLTVQIESVDMLLKHVRATVKKALRPDTEIRIETGDFGAVADIDGTRFPVGLYDDAYYPDWRRVLPAGESGEPAQFDFRYITLLGKACVEASPLRKPYVHVHHNGDSAAAVTFQGVEDFFAVIMPVRGFTEEKWCGLYSRQSQEQAA
jgi:DNA polymerase-3 subunit beta